MLQAFMFHLFNFFSIVVIYMVFRNISRIKAKWYEWVFVIIFSFSFINIVLLFFEYEIFMSILNCLFMIVFGINKNKKYISNLLYAAITMILIISIDSSVTSIAMKVYDFPFDLLNENIVYSSIILIIIWSLEIMVSLKVGKYTNDLFNLFSNEEKIKRTVWFFIFMSVIAVSLLGFFYLNVYMSVETTSPNTFILLNSTLLIIIMVFVIVLSFITYRVLTQDIELKYNKELVDNFQSYNMSINNMYTEMRSFRHDITTILSTAHGFIESDDFEGWKKYFMDEVTHLEKHITKHNNIFEQINNLHSPSLKGVLMTKFLKTLDSNINIRVGIQEGMGHISMNDIDLIRVIGVLFDNAIEECNKKENMFVEYVMYNEKGKSNILIVNNIIGKPPDIKNLFKENYSTKGDKRGVGLPNVQRIIGKHDNVLLKTYMNKGKFVQELNIYGVDN